MIRTLIHIEDQLGADGWFYALRNFPSDEVYIKAVNSYELPRADYLNWVDGPPKIGVPIVQLSPQKSQWSEGLINLLDFDHPDDALYVFYPNFSQPELLDADYSVYIPTEQYPHGMYDFCAYCVTMWDRRYG